MNWLPGRNCEHETHLHIIGVLNVNSKIYFQYRTNIANGFILVYLWNHKQHTRLTCYTFNLGINILLEFLKHQLNLQYYYYCIVKMY